MMPAYSYFIVSLLTECVTTRILGAAMNNVKTNEGCGWMVVVVCKRGHNVTWSATVTGLSGPKKQ